MRVAALCLLSAPALAQDGCPTGADLARGIRVEFVDGSVETFRAAAPGVVEVRGVEPDGVTYRLELAQGVHLLRYELTSDPAGGQAYDYGVGPDALPVPAPLARSRQDVTATDAAGPREEDQTQAWGAEAVTALGGCTFRTIEGIVAYDTADAYSEGLLWFPDLGISALIWQEDDGTGRETFPIDRLRVGK